MIEGIYLYSTPQNASVGTRPLEWDMEKKTPCAAWVDQPRGKMLSHFN